MLILSLLKNGLFVETMENFRNRDILIFPETCLGTGCRIYQVCTVIFNQNVSYSFGVKGSSVVHRPSSHLKLYRSSLVKHVLCVSQYDYNTLNYAFGIPDRKDLSYH